MSVGFTVVAGADGTVDLRLQGAKIIRTDRAALVSLARDASTHVTAILIGRLWYREDLIRRLPGPRGRPDASDATLVLDVYRRVGRRGLELLEGEFALVVWDGGRRRMLAVRDPLASWPLFWCATGQEVAAGTGLRDLLALRPSCRPDPDTLAGYLAMPSLAAEIPCESTSCEGVRRVPPGIVLELAPAGEVARHTFWDWRERIEPARSLTPQEAEEGVAALLRAAVRERLRDGSPAIVWTADAAGAALVRATRDVGGRVSLLTPGDEIDAFDWFGDDLPRHDEPWARLWTLGAWRRLVDGAEQLGAVTVLTRARADGVHDSPPCHLADLLRCGRWPAAWREAARWAAGAGQGPWSVLYRHGILPLLSDWRGAGPGVGSISPWVRTDFARRHGLRQRMRDHARRSVARPATLSAALAALASLRGDWVRWHLAAPRELNVSHPLLDPRLVCCSLGLQHLLRAPLGVDCPLLRSVVGPAPATDRTADVSGGSFIRGVRRCLPHLERMVRAPAVTDLGILDTDALVRALRSAAQGAGDETRRECLGRALSLAAWCRRAPWMGPPDVPARILRWEAKAVSAEGPERGEQNCLPETPATPWAALVNPN
jgi:asparagine synthase (glutamine-hydrolysing)